MGKVRSVVIAVGLLVLAGCGWGEERPWNWPEGMTAECARTINYPSAAPLGDGETGFPAPPSRELVVAAADLIVSGEVIPSDRVLTVRVEEELLNRGSQIVSSGDEATLEGINLSGVGFPVGTRGVWVYVEECGVVEFDPEVPLAGSGVPTIREILAEEN